MNKPKPIKKQKKETSDVVSRLLAFIDDNMPNFLKSLPYNRDVISSMKENQLTEALVRFFLNTAHVEGFSFMSQPNQEEKRNVDVGVFLTGTNKDYLFCIEAKFLRNSPFDYVTGKYAAIKRFKAKEHGLNSSIEKVTLPENGIIAYVTSGTFQNHFIKINKKIEKLSDKYSDKQDKFGLIWNKSEQLEKIYTDPILIFVGIYYA